MKKKEPRWHITWFFTSAMWLITFCMNLLSNHEINWLVVLQFLNIVISFAAGIINGSRYKKRNREDKQDN